MTRRAGTMVRASTRFCGAVLLTAGALTLADASVTLAWQEPVTALTAARAQSDLGRQLDSERGATRHDQLRITTTDPRRRVAALAAVAAARAHAGKAVGRITLPTLGRSYAFVQGVDTADLRRGPGHYPTSPFPGQGGTVAIAGHRTTYLAPFRTVDKLRREDPIVLRMPYGRLTYTVTGTRIVDPTNLSILKRVGYEQLVLTACHPVYSAAKRIVVFARLRSAVPAPPPRRSSATARRGSTATGSARRPAPRRR